MKEKIYNILLRLLMKVAKPDTVIVSMNYQEYHEYLEFKHNVFIVYENEQELKTDWPNAKQIIKKGEN